MTDNKTKSIWWTTETLLKLMDERDLRYEQRFVAQEKAIATAEQQAEKWRQNANEWRQSMLDRERQFFGKAMGYAVALISIISLVLTIVDRMLK